MIEERRDDQGVTRSVTETDLLDLKDRADDRAIDPEQIQNCSFGTADKTACSTEEWHRQSCLCELQTDSETSLMDTVIQ